MTEIRALTGIRGIAALWVLFLHFGSELSVLITQVDKLKPIFSKGHVGVDLFFILSGFIITSVYSSVENWEAEKVKSFIRKRFARVYPVHLFTLLILAGLVLLSKLMGKSISGDYSVQEFWYNVFMLQGFPISAASWNYPSWSVSAEFFGYLVIFPLTVTVFNFPGMRKYALLFSVLLIAGHQLLVINKVFGEWSAIARITFEFIAGGALFHGLRGRSSVSAICSRSLIVVFLIGLGLCYLPNHIMGEQYVSCLLYTSPSPRDRG